MRSLCQGQKPSSTPGSQHTGTPEHGGGQKTPRHLEPGQPGEHRVQPKVKDAQGLQATACLGASPGVEETPPSAAREPRSARHGAAGTVLPRLRGAGEQVSCAQGVFPPLCFQFLIIRQRHCFDCV